MSNPAKYLSKILNLNPTFLFALLMIILLVIARIVLLSFSVVELGGDEAQYWAWSKEPDFGYYSKPPMIAWMIWLTTSFLGHTEWAIRFSAPILHAGTALILLLISNQYFNSKTGLYAVIIYLLAPGISLSSHIISTDAILLFFASLALLAFLNLVHLTKKNHSNITQKAMFWGCLLGAFLGAGFLSKYAMLYLFLAFSLSILSTRSYRTSNTFIGLVFAIISFLIIISGNIAWNLTHQFATLSHTADNAHWDAASFRFHEAFQFLTDQFAIFGPIAFLVLMIAVFYSFKSQSGKIRLFGIMTLIPLLIVTIQAFISRAHANWAALAYLGGTLLLACFLSQNFQIKTESQTNSSTKTFPCLILYCSLCLRLMVFFILSLGFVNFNLIDQLNLSNTVKRVRGWKETIYSIYQPIWNSHSSLSNSSDHQAQSYHTIVTDDRMMFYEILYYGKDVFKNQNIRIWLLHQKPYNHAEFRAPLTELDQGDFLIVSTSKSYRNKMLKMFENPEFIEEINISLGGNKNRNFILYTAKSIQK